ncbi:MAG: hypothetical protein RR744_10835 [Cellulosilyticaceae bacterium]
MTANITKTLYEKKRKAVAIAKKAIAKGLDDETIVHLTELTIEEIQNLRK